MKPKTTSCPRPRARTPGARSQASRLAVRAATNAMAIAMANFGTARGHTSLPRERGGAGTYYCGGPDCNGLSMGMDHTGLRS